MDETPSTTPLETEPHQAGSSSLAWLVAILVATTALSLAAAHAPPRIRLIGLFSIVFGLLVGWLLTVLAERLDANPSRRLTGLVAAILAFCGLIGCMWETFRLEQARLAKSPKDGVALRLMEEMKTSSSPSQPQPFDQSLQSEFRRHLARRIQQLGDWSSPWPEIFWISELIAGVSASVWISSVLKTEAGTIQADRTNEPS